MSANRVAITISRFDGCHERKVAPLNSVYGRTASVRAAGIGGAPSTSRLSGGATAGGEGGDGAAGAPAVPAIKPASAAKAPVGEWRAYGADKAGTKYSPLDEINRETIGNLRIAWQRSSMPEELLADFPNTAGSRNFQHTPLMIDGLLYINGVPVKQLIAADKLSAMVDRTRKGGGEIVNLMGTSAYYAPAYSAIVMAEAYLLDQKRLLPAAAYLEGEYGYKDLYLGVPVIIGAGGVEKILQVELSAEEKAMLKTSADSVQKVVDIVKAKA